MPQQIVAKASNLMWTRAVLGTQGRVLLQQPFSNCFCGSPLPLANDQPGLAWTLYPNARGGHERKACRDEAGKQALPFPSGSRLAGQAEVGPCLSFFVLMCPFSFPPRPPSLSLSFRSRLLPETVHKYYRIPSI